MPLPNFDTIKSLAVGKDNPNRQQVVHILKAITDHEVPPKQKHIRGIILATFSGKSSSFLYDTALKLAIYTNPVVCWKFLYIIHKLFRDGHRECVNDGLRHATRVYQLKSAWSNHATKCGYPIVDFCQLIIRKLRLHRKYGVLPGSLELNPNELKNVLSAQVDHLFQFSVDLMDMMEETLRFKDVVLLSVEGIHAPSFTPPGQCKLIPLIQCIQDVAALYELSVQLIFKLHELLGNGTMSGHRDRFKDLHTSVKKFFENVFHMQYFRSFVHIPSISQNPPNFCIQSELNEHTTLRVTMNETPSLPSPPQSPPTTVTPADGNNGQHSGDEEDSFELADVPKVISHNYQTESLTEKQALIKLGPENIDTNDKTVISLNEGSSASDNHHQICNNSINSNNNMKMNRNPFLNNSIQTNSHELSPYQAHITDEKHEVLIEVELLKSEIERLKTEHHEQSYSLLSRIQILEDEIKELVQYKSNHEEQQVNYETKLSEKVCQAQIFEEKFMKLKEVYGKLREEHVILLKNYGNVQQNLQQETQKNEDLEKMIENLRHQEMLLPSDNVECLPTSENEAKVPVANCLELQNQLNDYRSKLDSANIEKDQLVAELFLLKEECCSMREKFFESQQFIKDYELKISKLTNELQELNDQLHRGNLSVGKSSNVCNGNTSNIVSDNDDGGDGHISWNNEPKQSLLTTTIEQLLSELQCSQSVAQPTDLMEVYIHFSPKYFSNYLLQIINHFNLFESAITSYLSNDVKGLIQTSFHIGQLNSQLSLLSLYSRSIHQSNTTFSFSNDYLHGFDLIQKQFMQLLNILQQVDSTHQDDENANDNISHKDNYFNQIKEHLCIIYHQLNFMLNEVTNLSNCWSNNVNNGDTKTSVDVIQKEMEATFEAITIAEQKFQDLIAESKSHSTSNENLQVNSLILDCCSELLLCVGELVKQSKIIQQEFKDSSTSIEFYKPYNRWTDGLLSAAKFVGAGANVMVEIANSIVCGKGVKLERLIVISQEIAASTTQLVYATRVKTNSQPEMFNKLQVTSKEVCKCTGNLIACVKKAIEAKHVEGTMSNIFFKMYAYCVVVFDEYIKEIRSCRNLSESHQVFWCIWLSVHRKTYRPLVRLPHTIEGSDL
ncbi:Huntington interacting protein related 1 isoform 1 [Schistosoma japonicum]|uniref:Huntington interacting protein related 1 isoform 1 n=1 Tax=Schistosoma japonicum TaxID=6182 RepID=A0A4Z2D084_SCHJA|nr:Huntington interacting protein related 1 isoform 1 [Schistosoma japonicum]